MLLFLLEIMFHQTDLRKAINIEVGQVYCIINTIKGN